MNPLLETKLDHSYFHELDAEGKKALYQEANERHDVETVRKLNELGMKPEVPSFTGPPIVSPLSDIATKYDTIFFYLKELRESGRLFTRSEFTKLSTRKWRKKGKLSRLMGCDYLIQVIREKNLKHIKVPKKIVVVKETESLKVTGWVDPISNFYEIDSEQMTSYAKKIPSAIRKISRDEIDELIEVIVAANFTDLWPQNVIVAEDGIYFIDTEFKSFEGSIIWGKMERFSSLISEDDQNYFLEKVKEKQEETLPRRVNDTYKSLQFMKKFYEKLEPSEKAKHLEEIQDIEKQIAPYEYVGMKKAGTMWFSPNEFTFKLSECATWM